jgi:putative hydroxymethylpyrimidine transport system substrate-binding protein
MRRLFGVAVAAVAVLALAACGEKKETLTPSKGSSQSLTLMLDWFPNADHVGIYQALAGGNFSNAALDVHVQVPSDPAAPLQLLAAGKVDLAVSYEPEVMLARDRGEPLVAVAALVQQPLTSIVSVGSRHIRSPSDLRGKTVGDAGIAYQHAYLTTILSHAHLPANSVKEVNVGANLVPAMLSGRVDASLGAFWNYEAIQLQQQGKSPNVIRMNQVGVPTYNELVVVARSNELTGGRIDVIRRFVQALGRGYGSVRSNPTGAVNNLLKANPSLDRKLQLASVRATLPAFFPSGADVGKPWGWQNPGRWAEYGQWMLSNHLVSKSLAFDGASTNEVLAGQGS